MLLRLALVLVAGRASLRGRGKLRPGVLLVGHGGREDAHKAEVRVQARVG